MMANTKHLVIIILAVSCQFSEASPIDRRTRNMRGSIELLKGDQSSVGTSKNSTDLIPTTYGKGDCQCVGIDYIVGHTVVTVKGGAKVPYPADVGARCEAWDMATHPECHGPGVVPKSWCNTKWCYVDPCKCKLSDAKPDLYIAPAKYQGKPIHWSYSTCDAATTANAETTSSAVQEICAASVDAASWGEEGCRCIGIGPQDGVTKVSIKGQLVDFPADTGSTCNKWEAASHPDCKGSNPPDFCKESWCYVDPCTCKLASPPKPSLYLPTANFQGKPIFYSYATCGGTDKYDTTTAKQTEEDVAKICK